jgi:phage/plasmid-like protein (TIGR03299 family)
MSLLDEILEQQSPARIRSEQHDTSQINWQAALGDVREMVKADGNVVEAANRRAALDTSNGRVNMFAAGTLPWHGLGVLVDKATTSAEAIKLAGLDWEVTKLALQYQFGDKRMTAADAYAMVRKDTGAHLGTVGKRYSPIQNAQAFDFLDGVLGEFGARYETAGSLYGGQKVWMLAHMPKQAFALQGGDTIEPYVVFCNCHDGSGAAWCYPTSVRVVCANTFRVSRKERHKGLSIRHTGNVKDKLRLARQALRFAADSLETFKEAAEAMHHKSVNVRHYANDVLDAVLEVTQADAIKGADALAAALQVTEAQRALEAKRFERLIERRGEILEDILNRYESERCSVGGIRGTAWGAFNAITEHADHAKLGRSAADQETRLSRRFESSLIGDADTLKQAAFDAALAV